LTVSGSQRCTTGKRFESCARACCSRRRNPLRHRRSSDQTPHCELGRASERRRMDVCDGYGLHCDVRRVISGASIHAVAPTFALNTSQGSPNIYAYFSIIKICRYSVVSGRSLPQMQDAYSFWTGSQRRPGAIRCTPQAAFDLRTGRMPPSGGLQRISSRSVSADR